jgi:AraC-like DNA-binding protein
MKNRDHQNIYSSKPLALSASVKKYNGRTFLFSITDFNIDQDARLVFPSIGYTIVNFFMGSDLAFQFLNYRFPQAKQHHMYITGLFYEEPMLFEIRGQGRGCAIKLHPVLAYHIFKEPMHLLANNQYLIGNLLEKEGVQLRKLEKDHQINIFKNDYLEKFLSGIMPDHYILQKDPIYHAVNMIIHNNGMIKIKDLAHHFCMSERTLNRQFLLKVGLSPKAYAKIWQWDYVTRLLQRSPYISIQELAFKAGYYDEAHLSHDFRNKMLQTTTEFRQELNPLIIDYLNFPDSFK